jgi:hypothetical protein
MNKSFKVSLILAALIAIPVGIFISRTETFSVDFQNIALNTPTQSKKNTEYIPPRPPPSTTESVASLRDTEPSTTTSPILPTATVTIEGIQFETPVKEGENIFDAMNTLKTTGKIDFTTREYLGMGQMILSINGKSSNGDMTWIFYVNGKKSNVGVSAVRISPGDIIEWKYEETY